MKFDLKNKDESFKAHEYFMKLTESENKIELKKVYPAKGNQQLKYFHVIVKLYAIEAGERSEYTKQIIVKTHICPEIFKTTYKNAKSGKIRNDWRSTADLDSLELTKVIDKVRTRASIDLGAYLPTSEEFLSGSFAYYQEIERNNEFL